MKRQKKKRKQQKKRVKSKEGPIPIGELFTEKDKAWFTKSDKKGLL